MPRSARGDERGDRFPHVKARAQEMQVNEDLGRPLRDERGERRVEVGRAELHVRGLHEPVGPSLADDAGETPERKALLAAFARRKVRVKKWAEEPPRGVVPLAFPPAFRARDDDRSEGGPALRGPCALLEF